jgi:hypothetical protein
LAAVKPDQLRDLTEVALKIANRLLLARGLKDECFTTLSQKAAEAMMKVLAEQRISPLGAMKIEESLVGDGGGGRRRMRRPEQRFALLRRQHDLSKGLLPHRLPPQKLCG